MIFGSSDYGLGGALIGALPGLGLLLSLTLVALMGILRRDLRLDIILVLFLMYTVMFVPKTRVYIEDVYSGATVFVDDVPIGVAAVGGISNWMSHEVAQIFDTVFQTVDVDYSSVYEHGFASPLRLMLSLRDVVTTKTNPYLMSSMLQFSRICADTSSMDFGGSQYKVNEFFTNYHSGLVVYYDDVDTDGITVTCAVSSANILAAMDTYVTALPDAKHSLAKDVNMALPAPKGSLKAACGASPFGCWESADIQNAVLTHVTGDLLEAQSFMLELVFHNLTNNVMACGNKSSSEESIDCVRSMSEALEAQKIDSASGASLFQKTVVPMMNFFQFLFYALSPIIAVVMMATGGLGLSIAAKYLLLGVWTQSWLPVVAVTNYFLRAQVHDELENYWYAMQHGGTNVFKFYDLISTKLMVASDMMVATPMITLAILTGSIFSISQLANRISSRDYVNEKTAAPSVSENSAAMTMGGVQRNTGGQGPNYRARGAINPVQPSSAMEAVAQKIDYSTAHENQLLALQEESSTQGRKASQSAGKVLEDLAGTRDSGSTTGSTTDTKTQVVARTVTQMASKMREAADVDTWSEQNQLELMSSLEGRGTIDIDSLARKMIRIAPKQFTGMKKELVANNLRQYAEKTKSLGEDDVMDLKGMIATRNVNEWEKASGRQTADGERVSDGSTDQSSTTDQNQIAEMMAHLEADEGSIGKNYRELQSTTKERTRLSQEIDKTSQQLKESHGLKFGGSASIMQLTNAMGASDGGRAKVKDMSEHIRDQRTAIASQLPENERSTFNSKWQASEENQRHLVGASQMFDGPDDPREELAVQARTMNAVLSNSDGIYSTGSRAMMAQYHGQLARDMFQDGAVPKHIQDGTGDRVRANVGSGVTFTPGEVPTEQQVIQKGSQVVSSAKDRIDASNANNRQQKATDGRARNEAIGAQNVQATQSTGDANYGYVEATQANKAEFDNVSKRSAVARLQEDASQLFSTMDGWDEFARSSGGEIFSTMKSGALYTQAGGHAVVSEGLKTYGGMIENTARGLYGLGMTDAARTLMNAANHAGNMARVQDMSAYDAHNEAKGLLGQYRNQMREGYRDEAQRVAGITDPVAQNLYAEVRMRENVSVYALSTFGSEFTNQGSIKEDSAQGVNAKFGPGSAQEIENIARFIDEPQNFEHYKPGGRSIEQVLTDKFGDSYKRY